MERKRGQLGTAIDRFVKSGVGRTANSELAYRLLIKPLASLCFERPLRKPTNENILKSVRRVRRIADVLIKDPKLKIQEERILGKLKSEFEQAVETGNDTNLTTKVKRTIGLMSSRMRENLIVNFGVISCGVRRLKQRPESEPHIEQFAMQTLSKCNKEKRCRGCFASEDEGKLDFETQRRLIKESRNLGSRFTIVLGGETLLDKNNLLKLFREFKKIPFIVATNGKLLDEAYAKEIAHLGNVITLINIPGLESTAKIIGGEPDTWEYIKRAAENLKKYGAAAGFASTVFQDNYKELSSPEFARQMIDFNMLIGFYFAYDNPFGCAPREGDRMTPEMNDEFSRRANNISSTHPLILVDTTNNAEEKIGGCPAGKASLIYVHSNGNVGTCPMDSRQNNGLNIHERSLGEILESRYFDLLRKERPPCAKSPDFIERLRKLDLLP